MPENEPLKSTQERLKERLEQIKSDKRFEEAFLFARSNTRDVIAYACVVLGLILLFTQYEGWGEFLIGLVTGIYFGDEIYAFCKATKYYVDVHGTVRSFIFSGFLLSLFILAPFIFIGIAFILLLKQVLLKSA